MNGMELFDQWTIDQKPEDPISKDLRSVIADLADTLIHDPMIERGTIGALELFVTCYVRREVYGIC